MNTYCRLLFLYLPMPPDLDEKIAVVNGTHLGMDVHRSTRRRNRCHRDHHLERWNSWRCDERLCCHSISIAKRTAVVKHYDVEWVKVVVECVRLYYIKKWTMYDSMVYRRQWNISPISNPRWMVDVDGNVFIISLRIQFRNIKHSTHLQAKLYKISNWLWTFLCP